MGKYNDTAPLEHRVQPGDFIMSVNNVQGRIEKMQIAMTESSTLEFVMRRPVKFSIALERSAKRGALGIGLDYIPGGGSLLVTEIYDGLVTDWNQRHPERKVERLARIVCVNGVMGDAEQMLEICKSEGPIELKVVHV